MSFTVSGIPMALIPHPQDPWLEGVTPITNLQWRHGIESFMNDGAKYCLLESHHRGDFVATQFGNLGDILDVLGRDNVPEDWDGSLLERAVVDQGVLVLFQWNRNISPPTFDGDNQPVVNVSWYHAKGWTLTQAGLNLLTESQWGWSARGGKKKLDYATATGELFHPDGKKLVHCSVGTEEKTTIDVDDPIYADGPFDLRHKTGNVWEWIERSFDIAVEELGYRVCGGAWFNNNPEYLRVDYLCSVSPGRHSYYGFRVGAPFSRLCSFH